MTHQFISIFRKKFISHIRSTFDERPDAKNWENNFMVIFTIKMDQGGIGGICCSAPWMCPLLVKWVLWICLNLTLFSTFSQCNNKMFVQIQGSKFKNPSYLSQIGWFPTKYHQSPIPPEFSFLYKCIGQVNQPEHCTMQIIINNYFLGSTQPDDVFIVLWWHSCKLMIGKVVEPVSCC